MLWSTSCWKSEPVSAGEYRRIATVVSWVPEATSAVPRPSRLGAPPVPMMSLEVSSTPSMTRLSAAVSVNVSAIVLILLGLP